MASLLYAVSVPFGAMSVRLLTLDCAGTLLEGDFDPVKFALWAACGAGLCPPARAATEYAALLRAHDPALLAANRTGRDGKVREEYVRLGKAWLAGLKVDPDLAEEVVAAGERLLASPELFRPFEDAVPFLVAARERGLRLAIVSNWDVSLSRVLAAHGLDVLVDEVYASLVVGAEKPDPTMLRLAMESAGVGPEETLHVGDDPEDDLGAAANAGVRGLLVKRVSQGTVGYGLPSAGFHNPQSTIRTLMEVLDWID